MTRFISSRKVYVPFIVLGALTLVGLRFTLPALLAWIAPSLVIWTPVVAWLIASGVGIFAYAATNQPAETARPTPSERVIRVTPG